MRNYHGEDNQEEYKVITLELELGKTITDNAADECLNDTLLDIWNSIPPNKPVSISSYACMLARRRSIDRLRKEYAEKRIHPDCSSYPDVCDELADIEDVAENIVDGIELSRHINKYLSTLSYENREIFISRYFDFEDIASIAKRLHVSKNSVNTRLFRMRNSFKEQLLKEGYINE